MIVKVTLRNPTREMVFDGRMSVTAVMNRLQLNRESVLIIRNGTLVPGDAMLEADDEIEVRPVISGGCVDTRPVNTGAVGMSSKGA